MKQYKKFGFEFLINRIARALNDSRLNERVCKQFKDDITSVKNIYGIELSKEYLIPFYKYDTKRKRKEDIDETFNQRIRRIMKKVDLKTEPRIRFSKELTSEKGTLFIKNDREILNFFIV